MKFTGITVSALLVACANALAAFGNSEFNVQAGKPFKLTWLGQSSATVDLKLKNGPQGALKDVLIIATGVSGTEFTWTPPATLPTDTYAFEIIDGGVQNWSKQFQFAGVAASSSAPTVSSSTTTPTPTSSRSSSSGSTTPTPSSSSSSTTTGPSSSSSQPPRPTQSGTILPPNSGLKSQSSSLALVAVVVATLFYLN